MLDLSKEVAKAYPDFILRKLREAETYTDNSINGLLKDLLS